MANTSLVLSCLRTPDEGLPNALPSDFSLYMMGCSTYCIKIQRLGRKQEQKSHPHLSACPFQLIKL